MAYDASSADFCGQESCVENTRTKPSRGWLRRLFAWMKPAPRHTHIKHISPHLARDIGLPDHYLDQQKHVWPSESVDRSRL
ncbi:hypothetical protein KX928_15895 [Roseobacter sp. YSTF-M11]|uniref:Uncharacterized protein n=1 Tax=Roseobacter insulae TaxID=2859783 RepID=A0A9X1K1J2_9RHOB|nr:hypothetical protein [Roseobacter insulae]MBW4709274.1 hypothetical protein [Roseobacter insulae]